MLPTLLVVVDAFLRHIDTIQEQFADVLKSEARDARRALERLLSGAELDASDDAEEAEQAKLDLASIEQVWKHA